MRLAHSYPDGAPLVAITGQVGTDRMHIPVVNTMMAKGINFSRIIDESFYRKTYVQNQIMGRAVLESVLFLE